MLPAPLKWRRYCYDNRFLCRAICAELAGETISLRDIIRTRNRRRRDLRQTLQERARMVDMLLEARRGDTHTDESSPIHDLVVPSEKSPESTGSPRLKRYINE